MTTIKKTPTKQSKREAKAVEKAKTKKPAPAKASSKCKLNCPSAVGAASLYSLDWDSQPAKNPHLHFYAAKSAPKKKDAAPEKKTRKKRDADAPKKPMSAFFWYQQARRNPIKLEKPELEHKQVIVVSINSIQ